MEWDALNKTVNGNLIKTSFVAEVCHGEHYDAAACANLKTKLGAFTNSVSPVSIREHVAANFGYRFLRPEAIMAPLFQNQSCNPFTPWEQPCVKGNFVEYLINVTTTADIAAGLKFTQEKNVRLVIKNTGHAYLGKSTGKGSLGLWMHNLKSISVLNYTSKGYTGPAIKMGAGVQGYEAYAAADAAGLRVVGGDCPTVGLVGGYTQGGGHSSLSSIYGMGADNALEGKLLPLMGNFSLQPQNKIPISTGH